jgi:predicted metal-dependent peptidase
MPGRSNNKESNQMSDTDRLATERVMKARAELIMSHTFYGVLVSNVAPKPSRQVETMATNGKTHFYNPDFVATLTQKELLGVQRHESEHDARRHHTRRGNRDAQEWNISCDYAINIDLVDEGVTLPKGALVDVKYRGWSAEEIFRARELDRAKQQQQQPQQQKQEQEQGEQDGDGDEADEAGATSDSNDSEPDDQSSEQGDGDGEGAADEADDGDENAEGDGDASGAQGGDDDAASDDGQGNEGDQADAAAVEQDGDGKQDGDDKNAGDDGAQIGHGDPGRCGEVLDAEADEPSDLSDADAEWERILRQAASLAAKRGTAPGHVSREIQRADNPPQDWRETLRAWFDQGAQRIETWHRPNRRFIASGIYMPGSQRDGLNRVVFLIDTSGSMDGVALACIAKETQAALDEGIIDEVVILYGDVRVTRVDTYQNGDEIVFDPRGGGGTDLRPLFKYVREFVDDCALIVAFSDMEIGDAGPEPACPVLWAVTGYPDRVKRYLANLPWDAAGIDVGSH